MFSIKDCKVKVSDKPKPNVFAIKLKSENSFVERYLATPSSVERDEWIEAIECVSIQLNGNFVIEKTVKEGLKKIVSKILL